MSLKVEYKSVKTLIPYVLNARTHSDGQVSQIAASIKEFGFNNPVLVDCDNGLIAGHGRLLAAEKLGMTEVPTIELGHLSDAERRAYILADNKLALNAGWDEELLSAELLSLDELGVDLSLIGFNDEELSNLLNKTDEEALANDELQEVAEFNYICEGDVWLLGKHRVMCGDSTNADNVGKLLDGVTPLLMVTDPPYGV